MPCENTLRQEFGNQVLGEGALDYKTWNSALMLDVPLAVRGNRECRPPHIWYTTKVHSLEGEKRQLCRDALGWHEEAPSSQGKEQTIASRDMWVTARTFPRGATGDCLFAWGFAHQRSRLELWGCNQSYPCLCWCSVCHFRWGCV